MKKFWFVISFIALLLLANLILKQIHIKGINAIIIDTQKTMSDAGITMESIDRDYKGFFFWEIETILNDTEFYSTISDCILYFQVPVITMTSKIKVNNTVVGDINFPSNIKGMFDLNKDIAKEYNMSKQYQLFLSSKNDIKINFNVYELGSSAIKEIIAKVPMIKLEFVEEGDHEKNKMFDISELTVNARNDQELHIISDVNNLNIYIGLDILSKYLPKSISVNDASKNILLQLDLTRINEKLEDKSLIKTYQGYFNTLTRAFDIRISGSNASTRAKTGEKTNISDLDFSIREFNIFMEYCTGIVMSMKRQSNPNYDIGKVQKTSNLFKDAVLKNAEFRDGNITIFRVQDKDKQTFFQGKPIQEVFSKFIEKAKEID